MASTTTRLQTIRPSCPNLWPLCAVAVVSLLLGCSAVPRYAPAVLGPSPGEPARYLEPRPVESAWRHLQPKPLERAWRSAGPRTGVEYRRCTAKRRTDRQRSSLTVERAAATPRRTALQSAPPAPAAESISAASEPRTPKTLPELAAEAALLPDEEFDETRPAHHLARCRIHMSRSQWSDAIDACRKAAELAPKSAEPWAELMRVYVTIGSYTEGAEAARAVLARDADNATGYYYLGWALSGGKQHQASIQALQKAVSIDPTRVEYHQGLGISYSLTGNFARAIAALEDAQKLDPQDTRTKDLLEQTRSQLAARLSAARKAAKSKPRDPDSHAKLGSKLQQYGFVEEALAEYDCALVNIPSPLSDQDAATRRLAAVAHFNRGVLLRELRRGDAATQALRECVEIDPSLAAEAWYFIGLVAYDEGDYKSAIGALSNSVEDAPRVIENRRALALAYEKSGNKAAAKQQRSAIAELEEEGVGAYTPATE